MAGDKAGVRAIVAIAEKSASGTFRNQALSDIAAMQAEAGDIAGALQTAGKIDGAHPGDADRRAQALSAIAAVIAKAE